MHPLWIHSFIKTAGPCKHLRWQPALFHTSATFGSPGTIFLLPFLVQRNIMELRYTRQIKPTILSKVPLPSLAPQGKRHHGTQPRALILGFSCLLSGSPSSCSGKLYFCLKRQEALLVQYFGCPPCPSPQAILLSAHTCPFCFPDFLGFQNSKARTVLALFFCCVIASCRPMITAAWVLWVERILKQ